jgi:O-antigen ligase
VEQEANSTSPTGRDPLARVLEWGLGFVLVAAPLPFGAVTPNVVPHALLALELACFLLGVAWLVRAGFRPTRLPPRAVLIGLAGLLALGLLQALPLGPAVSIVSPRAMELRDAALAPDAVLAAETRLLGSDPQELERPASLSLDPETTASSVRLGAALACLILVAACVVRERGPRGIALALLVSAAFQGLYGVLVLASGHEMIWNVPKKHYLDSATGTFVNRNHYAGYVAASLCCGVALLLRQTRAARGRRGAGRLRATGHEVGRAALYGILAVLALAGLLLSFSRAGIAVGIAALMLTVLSAGGMGRKARLAIVALLIVSAAVPLGVLGTERLAERYSDSLTDLAAPGGRLMVWGDTLSMAAAFPVTGTGFGTFSTAYPLFRSPEVRLFFRHAHNDGIQWIAESGILGTLLLAVIAVPLFFRLSSALGGGHGTLAVGIAAGLLGLVVHTLIDFQFRIPSNAALGAALAGMLFGLPWKDRS